MSTTEQQAGFDCGAQLAAARSTISEQEKRIAELEQKLADMEHHAEHELLPRKWAAEERATSERQRREEAEAEADKFLHLAMVDAGANPAFTWKERCEEAEAVCRIMAERPLPIVRTMYAANAAEAHFRKYEPGE